MKNVRAAASQRIHLDAPFVHGNVGNANQMALVYLCHFHISRIFQGIFFILSKKLDQKPVQVFCPRADDDLILCHVHSLILQKVFCNSSPQRKYPCSGCGNHQFLLFFRQHQSHQPCPERKRKLVLIGAAADKVNHCRQFFRDIRDIIWRRESLFSIHPRKKRAVMSDLRLWRQQISADLCHIIAGFWHGIQISLRHQLRISIFHRNHADPQIFGKSPFRREFLPRPDFSLQDITPDTFIKIFVQAVTAQILKRISKHIVFSYDVIT